MPQKDNVEYFGSKIEVVDISGMVSEYIRRSHYNESVSVLSHNYHPGLRDMYRQQRQQYQRRWRQRSVGSANRTFPWCRCARQPRRLAGAGARAFAANRAGVIGIGLGSVNTISPSLMVVN